MRRALSGLLLAFLAVIAAAQITYRVNADPGEPGNRAWAQNEMRFVAWNGQRWTAWVHDDGFELVPNDGGRWSRHSNASIAFVDWDGEPWQAKVDGDVFLLAEGGNWQVDVRRSGSIEYRDWAGNRQLRTVAELTR